MFKSCQFLADHSMNDVPPLFFSNGCRFLTSNPKNSRREYGTYALTAGSYRPTDNRAPDDN